MSPNRANVPITHTASRNATTHLRNRATFDAMQSAVHSSLPDFRRWMRVKGRLHGDANGLSWWNLFAPLSISPGKISWDEGISLVKGAFANYSSNLALLVDRSIDERSEEHTSELQSH